MKFHHQHISIIHKSWLLPLVQSNNVIQTLRGTKEVHVLSIHSFVMDNPSVISARNPSTHDDDDDDDDYYEDEDEDDGYDDDNNDDNDDDVYISKASPWVAKLAIYPCVYQYRTGQSFCYIMSQVYPNMVNYKQWCYLAWVIEKCSQQSLFFLFWQKTNSFSPKLYNGKNHLALNLDIGINDLKNINGEWRLNIFRRLPIAQWFCHSIDSILNFVSKRLQLVFVAEALYWLTLYEKYGEAAVSSHKRPVVEIGR